MPPRWRYYKGVGLIEPGRAPSGYRIYDDRVIERLHFMARAKALGLTLYEISELLPIWEGYQCTRCRPTACGQRHRQIHRHPTAHRRAHGVRLGRDIEDKRARQRAKEAGKPRGERKAPGRLVEGATVHGWKAALGALAYPYRIAGRI